MTLVPQPDPGVLSVALPDDDLILLHQDTRMYFSLNRTASLIWKMMEQSASAGEICQSLSDRFDVTPEAAHESVRELLRDLKTHKLITLSEARSRE